MLTLSIWQSLASMLAVREERGGQEESRLERPGGGHIWREEGSNSSCLRLSRQCSWLLEVIVAEGW